ncbi:MAG: SDR family oxidoreductase [Armatimonadetes bacterium]|nr:SDR family oxidoreductase [Armatimonadota bacterium]
MGRLQDKVAVITGSTSGIGACIARRFAEEGARVVVSGRRVDEGERVVAGIVAGGGRAVFQRTDLAQPDDCRALIARAVDEFGDLEILVNNAGIFPRADRAAITPEFWGQIQDVNVRGAMLCGQAAEPIMVARGGGSIINMGSCNAFIGGENLLAYSVSKGALYNLTMNWARHLAKHRIRANWISVGWVLTEMERQTQGLEGRDEQGLEHLSRHLPMGEFNTEDDMAAGCVYLASDDAVRVTGSNLVIAAGMGVRV